MRVELGPETPNYFISEAAWYLRVPYSTAYAWSMGRGVKGADSHSLIVPADKLTPLLSFSNLVELHIIAAMRKSHKISTRTIRKGINFLSNKLGVKRPLLDQEMLTCGKDLLIDRLGQLVNISANGQLHLREAIASSLDRVQRDESGLHTRMFPFTRPSGNDPRFVTLDPYVCSGRPCVVGTRLPTNIIASRHRAGDGISFLADDYSIDVEKIEEAIRYESRTAA